MPELLTDQFLATLIAELDDTGIAGIILDGSHARGDATAYSDVDLAVAYATAELLSGLTEAVAVQRGVLVKSDSTYYRQVQESAGQGSAWTRYHRLAAGIASAPSEYAPATARGIAALLLYVETV